MVILEDDINLDDILQCICGFVGDGKEMFEHYIIEHPNILIQLEEE